MRALRIAPDTTVTELNLPETGACSAIRDQLGTASAVGQGVYHRRALLHFHGDGRAIGLAQNIATWALASSWRGMVPYRVHGPVTVAALGTGKWPHWTTAWPSAQAGCADRAQDTGGLACTAARVDEGGSEGAACVRGPGCRPQLAVHGARWWCAVVGQRAGWRWPVGSAD